MRDKVDLGLLHWTAYCGYERIVQRLLEKGAYIAEKDRYGQTALSCAAIKGHEAVVELLLAREDIVTEISYYSWSGNYTRTFYTLHT